MSKITLRKTKRDRRKVMVRKKVYGTKEMPRLSVFRSNMYTYAQIIDDDSGATLAGVSLNDIKSLHKGKKKMEAAKEVGKKVAELAKERRIKNVVFDRNGYKYHGRIKMLAEGARESGLSF